MKVSQILAEKGGSVVTIPDHVRIKDAIEALRAHNIGAVMVVRGDGSLAGILSERDVVRRLSRDGAAAIDAEVADCMTPSPVTCAPSAGIDDLMSVMTERRIRHLPVLDGGRLVGVVSIGDVVKRKIEHIQREAEALKDYIASG